MTAIEEIKAALRIAAKALAEHGRPVLSQGCNDALARLGELEMDEPAATFRCWTEPSTTRPTGRQLYDFSLNRVGNGLPDGEYQLYAHPAAAPQVPAGWQMVPIEPTPEMTHAAAMTPGMRAIDNSSAIMQLRGYPLDKAAFLDGSPLEQAWSAMLSAAPKEPTHSAGVEGKTNG